MLFSFSFIIMSANFFRFSFRFSKVAIQNSSVEF